MSPPNQAAQSPNLHAPGLQAGPTIARPPSIRPGGSPGIVNGQAMSQLLRANGMHEMHMNLANGVIPPSIQQNSNITVGLANGSSMFGNGLVNGAAGLRGQLGPERMNQLLLVSECDLAMSRYPHVVFQQQAARTMSALQQNQQQQQSTPQATGQAQSPAQPTTQPIQVPNTQPASADGDVTMQ